MTDRTITLTLDVTDAIPTLADLTAYGIAAMRVVTAGPGGGNPELTLTFADGAGEGRPNALRFLTDCYASDDPEGDLTLATGAPAPMA